MKINLPNFLKANILVVGDVMLDKYCYGYTNKISQEANIPVFKLKKIKNYPGGAANVAMNIAALGAHSYLIGVTGIDESAYMLIKQLKNLNIKYNFINIPSYPTITKIRILSKKKQLIRIDFEKKIKNINLNLIIDNIKKIIHKINVIVISDYAKGTLTKIREIIKICKNNFIPVLVDPKNNNFDIYSGATIIKPNLKELEAVVGYCKNEKILINRSIKLLFNYKISAMLITNSEKGMILIQPDKKPLFLKSNANKISNVTGAGDTVIGVLATSLAAGNNLENSCIIANIAAGIVVEKFDTATVNYLELNNIINFLK